MNRHPILSTLLVAGIACMGALPAAADTGTPSAKAQRYSVLTPYSDVKAGAARIRIQAPIDVVTQIVTDFNHYDKLNKNFDKSRVIGKAGKKTDVYLQVKILKGAGRIWAVIRFDPLTEVNGTRILKAHMRNGNVERLDATWHIKRIDDSTTELSLEMLILPSIPFPSSLITPELQSAADKAVSGSRKLAESR
jgi:hypothetical protein